MAVLTMLAASCPQLQVTEAPHTEPGVIGANLWCELGTS